MEVALKLDKEELKKLIKEAVREVIEESKWNLFEESLPYVSDREMEDIEAHCGEPDEEVFYSEELDIE